MSASLQLLLVVLAVGVALLYSAWRLMPAAARLRLLMAMARLPLLRGHAGFEAWRARAAQKAAAGCGGCAPATGAPPAKRTPGALRR
ncbi:MAG: hypothetical protein JSS29_19205 [Proteobacteria bacterium]|nr:hypothetical protein [Pseudomonadota bacterium]